MNISLTLNFDNMSELEAYLASRTTVSTAAPVAAAAAPVASAAPVPVPASTAAPAPVAVAPVPTPAPTPAPVLTAVPAPTPAADDTVALKTRIMDRLKAIAQSLPDQSELGKFITAFGVQRFSDLPDERLAQFEELMNQQYPVA